MKENGPVTIQVSKRRAGELAQLLEKIFVGIHLFSLAIEEAVTIDKLKVGFVSCHTNQYNYTVAALGAK